MSDVLKIAQQRRKVYEAAIAEKERELEELREIINDLDTFLDFGETLIGSGEPETAEVPQPDAEDPHDADEDWDVPANQNSLSRVLSSRS